jgi:2-oxo-4-hydroxy-4-carboxy-5-ureidoimidazoline decarboxylase
MNINEVNNLDENVFFEIFKNIFEHSDFITKLVQKKRPFKKKSEIINHFLNIFDSLDKDTKVNIIKSHPDLGDKLKIKEGLTSFSQEEQSKAGLAECTDEEFNEFKRLNNDFKSKFNIPFIYAVRGKTKKEILDEFISRLKSDNIEQELDKSLIQVKKIATLRINEIISDEKI